MISIARKWFTMVEMMMAIAVIWFLITALSTSYLGYQKRSRDTSRTVALSSIGKIMGTYFTDFGQYPPSNAWCIDYSSLSKYLSFGTILDPIASYDNGCGPIGRYAYGMSTWLTNPPYQYLLMAKMEMGNSGNYGWDITGMTGNLTQTGYINSQNIVKGSGEYFLLSK